MVKYIIGVTLTILLSGCMVNGPERLDTTETLLLDQSIPEKKVTSPLVRQFLSDPEITRLLFAKNEKKLQLNLLMAELEPVVTASSSAGGIIDDDDQGISGTVQVGLSKDADLNNLFDVKKDIIENDVTISQFSYLCTAGHDYKSDNFQLIADDILIKTGAWIGAKSYIGGGVVIGSHAVIGACSTVTKSIAEYTLVAGNPAEHVKSIK